MIITVPSHPKLRLGLHDPVAPRMLHFNTIKRIGGIDTSSPQRFDYVTGMPANTGALFNDQYGCCTASAKYHRLQVVVFVLTGVFLEGQALQDLALAFYAASTGFDPTKTLPDGTNPTDQGGDMQAIAEFLCKVGMMRPDGTEDKFAAAFMIDPSNMQDLLYCGRECIGIDFGITVTTNVMPPSGATPPTVWNAGGTGISGHDVFGAAVLPSGNWKVDSWGSWYEMTPAFMQQNVSQCVAYVSQDSLKDGKTVLGLDTQGWLNALDGRYESAA
jgi:hypothetical protein